MIEILLYMHILIPLGDLYVYKQKEKNAKLVT